MVAPVIGVVLTAIGAMFTGVCAWFGVENRNLAQEALAETRAKVTEDWNKSACNLTYSTASGGKKFYHYAYEAKGDHLDCEHLPKRKDIEKDVKAFSKSLDYRGQPYGCRENKKEKAYYWQIRISRNETVYPLDEIVC